MLWFGLLGLFGIGVLFYFFVNPGGCCGGGRGSGCRSHKRDGDSGKSSQALYTCSMHPEIRRKTPGQCPKCGMNLEPVVA